MKISHLFLVLAAVIKIIICEEARLKLQYQETKILEYSIEFTNFETYRNNRFEYVNLWGKLCFANNFT